MRKLKRQDDIHKLTLSFTPLKRGPDAGKDDEAFCGERYMMVVKMTMVQLAL